MMKNLFVILAIAIISFQFNIDLAFSEEPKYGGKLCSTACAVSYIKRIKSVYNSENGKVRPTSTSGWW